MAAATPPIPDVYPDTTPSLAERLADGARLATPDQWLRLACCPGLGATRIARLVARYGGPDVLLDRGVATLAADGIRDREVIAALTSPPPPELAAARAWLEAPEHHLLALDDPRYPAGLRELDDPPPVLFVNGDPDSVGWPGVAVVGTRKPSPAGVEQAGALAAGLARSGLSVVSGLALGIDAAAHRGALEAEGPTVAVLGCGPDQVYPTRHRALAAAIRDGGALIAELPPGTPPMRHQFPRRNRIIAGMTLGTVVVEAARRSGSLITARLALEAGREVMAVPGPVRNPGSRGCHRLIRDGARLVEDAADVVEEVAPGIVVPLEESGESAKPGTRSPEARRVLDALGTEPEYVDTLVERCGLTPETVSSMLILLELEGAVVSAPGGRYSRATKRPS
jgi:DNA processing protein